MVAERIPLLAGNCRGSMRKKENHRNLRKERDKRKFPDKEKA